MVRVRCFVSLVRVRVRVRVEGILVPHPHACKAGLSGMPFSEGGRDLGLSIIRIRIGC